MLHISFQIKFVISLYIKHNSGEENGVVGKCKGRQSLLLTLLMTLKG